MNLLVFLIVFPLKKVKTILFFIYIYNNNESNNKQLSCTSIYKQHNINLSTRYLNTSQNTLQKSNIKI